MRRTIRHRAIGLRGKGAILIRFFSTYAKLDKCPRQLGLVTPVAGALGSLTAAIRASGIDIVEYFVRRFHQARLDQAIPAARVLVAEVRGLVATEAVPNLHRSIEEGNVGFARLATKALRIRDGGEPHLLAAGAEDVIHVHSPLCKVFFEDLFSELDVGLAERVDVACALRGGRVEAPTSFHAEQLVGESEDAPAALAQERDYGLDRNG
eukprot:scaffold52056_cov37-Tisochrysis_lutea.AAC.2